MIPVYFASLDSTWHGMHSVCVCATESQVHFFVERQRDDQRPPQNGFSAGLETTQNAS